MTKLFLSLPIILLLLLSDGCSSPERTAYLATGTVTTTANAAIGAYYDWRIVEPQSLKTDFKVRQAVKAYLAALDVAEAAIKSYEENKGSKDAADAALSALSAASGDLVALIRTLLPPEKLK